VASNAITSIVWDFGDGFTETVANSPIRSRNYAQAGAYTVTATATATTSDGSKTAPIASKAITVNCHRRVLDKRTR
jgi:PKD repeat protein